MRDTAQPLPFARAARAVFDLSLESMVWSRRSLLMAILLGLPVAFAVLYRAVLLAHLPPSATPFDLFGLVVAFYWVRNVLPLAALFYGSALVAEEVEGRTITYLLSRPVPRAAVLLGKYAAYLVTTLCLTLPALVVTFFLLMTTHGFRGISGAVPDLFRDVGVVALTLAVYGALFTLLGVALRRPVIPGLLFLFVWEMAANLPGDFPKYTITAYLRSLIGYQPTDQGLVEAFAQILPTALSLEVLTGLVLLFLGEFFWIFGRREFVLDQ